MVQNFMNNKDFVPIKNRTNIPKKIDLEAHFNMKNVTLN